MPGFLDSPVLSVTSACDNVNPDLLMTVNRDRPVSMMRIRVVQSGDLSDGDVVVKA